MAFFQNNPEAEQSPGRTSPLFKQESEGAPSHVTLNEYISRHFRESSPEKPEPTVPASFGPTPIPAAEAKTGLPQGQFLNSLDVDLTSGLEQYMPTPLFRLRVVKKRLDTEIAELRDRLAKYDFLPEKTEDMLARMQAVRHRIRVLETHEQRVSRELGAMLRWGPLFNTLAQAGRRLQDHLGRGNGSGRQFFGQLLYGPAYGKLETAHAELRDLREMMVERLIDKSVPDAEISRILTRYEQTARRLETVSLRPEPAWFLRRLWQRARALLK